jgi:hypothetical protein
MKKFLNNFIGFVLNVGIIWIIGTLITKYIIQKHYNFLGFYDLKLQENIIFFIYFIIFGIISQKYLKYENIGDFIIGNKRNSKYIEKEKNIYFVYIHLYLTNMIRIILDMLFINIIIYFLAKRKEKKIQKELQKKGTTFKNIKKSKIKNIPQLFLNKK